MNMNAREKFLVIILAATIILLGGFKLLIEPKIKTYTTAKTQYAAALSEERKAEDAIIQKSGYEKGNQDLADKINSSSDAFFSSLENDQMQLFFSGLADHAGISFDSFTMTDKVTTQITASAAIDNGISYPMGDAAKEIQSMETSAPTVSPKPSASGTAGAASNGEQAKDLVEMMTVSMQFNGTYQQILTFLDQLKASGKTLRISSLNITAEANGALTANISTECFGIAKLWNEPTATPYPHPTAEGKTNPFQ